MPKYGDMDIEGFRELTGKVNKLAHGGFKQHLRATVNAIALDMLALMKENTPVGDVDKWGYITPDARKRYWSGYQGGSLRDAWQYEIKKESGGYSIELVNPLHYASAVEYGHSQQKGRYVKQIGRRLVRVWIPGEFFMKATEDEIRVKLPRELKRLIEAKLMEVFNGK